MNTEANSMPQIISLSVVMLWTTVAIWTARRAITGEMFQAPCLKDLRTKEKPCDVPKEV